MSLLDDLPLITLTLIFGIMFLSGLVHGTLGLGFPLVATPILALLIDVRSAVLITLLPTISVNVVSILRGGRWRESIGTFWPLAVYAVIGSVIGTAVLIVSDPRPFKLLLAALILLYLGASRLGALKLHWIATHTNWSMLLFGMIAGLAAGTTNVMVPILVIYSLELGLSTIAMVQVFNMCFLAGKISQMATLSGAGVLGSGLLTSTAPLAGVAILALIFGMIIRDRFPTESYRRIVKRILFVIAIVLVAQFFMQADTSV